ncbi:LacI family transcriptional regulator [Paenibacillus segetis]|uniref:LacI family transcriptional regulator n=1 Tax=Paenibacillus segetis TaxID=1325360 RepID=A0ABQ1YHU5_9BACL|nr:LacI family transcriptional regulator [Paenibacillus segetis]
MGRKKKVSMQDIASKLEISKNAVSLALMNKKGVSEEMRALVLHTAREMGYGPFATKESAAANILVLVPERIMSYQDNDHFQFYHDMIWGLEKSIRKKGYNAVIAPIDQEMETGLKLPGLFTDISYRGVILFGIIDKAYARLIWDMDTPLVMLDSYYRDLPCPVVTSANMEGAYEVVSFLIDGGHEEIGFIGPTNLTTSHEERWFGYWKAMQTHGLEVQREYCLTSSEGYNQTEAEIAQFLDGLRAIPTAFFCGNDRIAYILRGLLEEREIAIPERVSIAGFDDTHYGDHVDRALTTMRVEKEMMCDAAASMLLTLTGNSRESIRHSVAPTLVVRSSVKNLKE